MVIPTREQSRSRFGRMFRRRSTQWSQKIVEAFPEYADLMSRVVSRDVRRYRRFGRAHMVWFRLSGAVEVVLSVTFPFVVQVLNPVSGVVTGISVAIGLAGALAAFYAWNDNWRLYRTQHLVLNTIVGRWELKLLRLASEPEPRMQEAHDATEQAITEYVAAIENEHDVYFGNVTVPRHLMEGSAGNGSQATAATG